MKRAPASTPVEYTGSARQLDYYSLRPSRRFQCKCGWVGPFSDLEREVFDELFDASCPTCGTMLAIVSFPTADDVHRVARQGNGEAQKELRSVNEREAFLARYSASELVRPDQLPDIEGRELRFEWTSERTEWISESDGTVVIRLLPDGREIWREVEAYENWPHFIEVRNILRTRYGARYKSLTPTPNSEPYLYGDDIFAADKVAREEIEWMQRHSSDQRRDTGETTPRKRTTARPARKR